MAKAGAAGVALPAAAVFPATTVPAAAARRPLLSVLALPLRQEGPVGPASRTRGPGPFTCGPDPGVHLPHTLLDRPSSLRLFLLASLADGPASGAFQRQHQAPLPTPHRPSTTTLAGINRLWQPNFRLSSSNSPPSRIGISTLEPPITWPPTLVFFHLPLLLFILLLALLSVTETLYLLPLLALLIFRTTFILITFLLPRTLLRI